MKTLALALAVLLGAAVVVPALTVPAEAQQRTSNYRYTSGDIAKGYRC